MNMGRPEPICNKLRTGPGWVKCNFRAEKKKVHPVFNMNPIKKFHLVKYITIIVIV